MKPFSGAALNSYKSIQLGSGRRKHIRYQNPFNTDPYTQMTPTKDLCRFWAEESRIRQAELEKYNRNRG